MGVFMVVALVSAVWYCRWGDGESQRHPAAAVASADRLGGPDADGAAMHLGHAACERQAEAEAARCLSLRPRLVEPVKGRQDPLALRRGYAVTLVGHRQGDTVPVPLGLEHDGRSAILGRVVHEVPERAPEQRAIRCELDRRTAR